MKSIIEKKLLKQDQMETRVNRVYKQYNILTGNSIIRSQYWKWTDYINMSINLEIIIKLMFIK